MRTNLLIGAISGNYNIDDVRGWIETSNFENVERLLLLYNDNAELEQYLHDNNVSIIKPSVDCWGQEKNGFSTNTGTMTLDTSYDLIHNIRFFHIWSYLKTSNHDKVIITDVRDVYFNENPFTELNTEKITATGEVIKYNESNGRLKFYTLTHSRHTKLLRRFHWSKYNNERYGYFDEFIVPIKNKCFYVNAWELLYKRLLLPEDSIVRCNYLKQEYRTTLPIGGNI